MRKLNGPLFDALKKPSVHLTRCWQIIPEGASPIGFTEHDKELTIDGIVYEPTDAFSGSALVSKDDFSVDNMSIVGLNSDQITEEDLRAGVYDNAQVFVFAVQYDDLTRGVIPLRSGRLGEVVIRGQQFETEMRTHMQRLQQPIGRVYGIECDVRRLGDARCKVDTAPFTFTGTVAGVSTRASFSDPARTEADNFFKYGTLRFTTGANAGRELEVKDFRGKRFVLIEPMPFEITPGDQYEVIAGCDRTRDTCRDKFNNLDNFRGFPDMPTETEILETPNAK